MDGIITRPRSLTLSEAHALLRRWRREDEKKADGAGMRRRLGELRILRKLVSDRFK
jgi:hypothetical protein